MPDAARSEAAKRGAQTRKKNAANAATLSMLAKQYAEYDAAEAHWRPYWQKARDYYDNRQLTDDEVRILQSRKEPIVIDNIIKDKIDSMLGVEIESRTEIRALPRNPSDEEGADAATDALRFVSDNNELPKVFTDAAEYEWIEHTGAIEIVLSDAETSEIGVKRLRSGQTFFDPTSRELDFSDARYRGVKAWWDIDKLRDRYPGKANAAAIQRTLNHQVDNYDPDGVKWADPNRQMVLVFQTYWRDDKGVMQYAIWTRGGFLNDGEVESPGESPYLDDMGEPDDPYEWQSTYITRDGRRYGLVERLLDLQDEINKRRSKGLHYLNTNQLHYETGAIDDPRKAAEEIRKPDGVVEYNRNALLEGRARVDKNIELAAGNMQMLQDSRDRLSGVGPADALAGKGGTSGRHLQTQQQGELIPLSLPLDRHRSLKTRVYRAIWARIKQFWTEARWVRVRDSDSGESRFTPVNVDAATLSDVERTQIGLQMALSNQTLPEVLNPLKDMDFDIVLDEVPDVATLQEEQFGLLVRLAELGVTYDPSVYLELSSFPNKRRLKDLQEQAVEKQSEGLQQQQQIQAQMLQQQFEKMQAEIDELKSRATKNEAQAKEISTDTAIKLVGEPAAGV